jgi:uncharacterized LabA/DUF88 family protein
MRIIYQQKNQKQRKYLKMSKRKKIYAFIDSSNVYLSLLLDQDWKLDWRRFRKYLTDKYQVTKAFLFIGYLRKNKGLYKSLKQDGYKVIFKKAMILPNGEIKGNVDADLVLYATTHLANYEKAIIVTGDGDYASLIETLENNNKLLRLIIPNREKYSFLLTKGSPKMTFLSDLREKLEFKGRHKNN